MMDTATRLSARLAAAPHAVQVAFAQHMERNSQDQGSELTVLSHYMTRPADLLADRPAGNGNRENLALWSDADVIEILTDAREIDKVTGRPLGTWEITRLTQRDMIRRALVKA